MLTETMTLAEMQKEVGKDNDPLSRRVHHFRDDTRRFFLKSKAFPVYRLINWKSYVTNNEWTIILLVREKKYMNEPAIIPYAKIQSYGMGVVYMRPITDRSFFIINYTPHFFSRYNERYIIPGRYNITDAGKRIEHFFVNNSMPSYDFTPADNNFIGYHNQGIIFGEHTEDRTALRAKTFVPRSMLYSDQTYLDNDILFIRKEVANSPDYLRDRNQVYGIERYGKLGLHRDF